MRYKFNDFEFDESELILSQNGTPVSIRHTEAKVLAALLEHSHTILTKDQLLALVWQDRVVSQQVIFQNISHLRNLFGEHAIKTFPKRGYQWQLEVEKLTSANLARIEQSADKFNQAPSTTINPRIRTSRLTILVSVFIALAIFISIFAFTSVDEKQSAQLNIAYTPFFPLTDNDDINFHPLTLPESQHYQAGIELAYPKENNNYSFVLSGDFQSYKQMTYLEFTLRGPHGEWQGVQSGSNKEEVVNKLKQHLLLKLIYETIDTPLSPEVESAKLAIAHQAAPNDLIILENLSITYVKTNELDKAMAATDKLIVMAKAQNNDLSLGRALLHQSKILTRKDLYKAAQEKLSTAITLFEKINDKKQLVRSWYYQSWIDDYNKDFLSAKNNLLKSAQLAAESQNHVGEIEALIYISVLANEYHNAEDKYAYLKRAENTIKAHQMADYHLAKVSYRYALFTKNMAEKESYLKQVLSLNTSTPEHWTAQFSRKLLVKYYLNQGNVQAAHSIMQEVKATNSNNLYLRTLIASSTGETATMLELAQRTFERAQLAGKHSLCLDMAILLASNNVNIDFYSLYIEENASKTWRYNNQAKLKTLNL